MEMMTLKDAYERVNLLKDEISFLNEKAEIILDALEKGVSYNSRLLEEAKGYYSKIISLTTEKIFYEKQIEEFKDIEILKY